MHHKTKYHLIYLTILTTLIWLLRKLCLNSLEVYEYLLISLVLYPLFMVPFIYYKRGNLSIDFKKIDRKIFLYLLIIMFLAVNSSLYFHHIAKNEDISVGPSLVFGLRILTVFIAGVIFLNEKFTRRKLLALIIILTGFFLFASDTNK